MKDYYEDLISEIDEMMQEGQYEEAKFLVNKELSLPYIPKDVEEKLHQYYRDIIYQISEQKEQKEESLETLLNKLKSGKPASVLFAAEMLCERNLRSCIKEIQDFLRKDPLPEASALLIDAIGEQEIQEEFILKRNNVEYTFFGDSVVPINQSEGFKLGWKELNTMYEKEPSKLHLAKQLFIHKAYLTLPLTIEPDEIPNILEEIDAELSEYL